MPWEEIINLLGQSYDSTVKFIGYTPTEDEIAKDLVAFANAKGGKIVMGIDLINRFLIGTDFEKEVIFSISRERCFPRITPTIEVINKDGKTVMLINIFEGTNKPYRYNDLIYIHDSRQNRIATPDEEKEIKSPWQVAELNKRQRETLSYLMEQPFITNRRYRQLFSVSHKTAHLDLRDLRNKNLVICHGRGRNTAYSLVKSESDDLEARSKKGDISISGISTDTTLPLL